MRRKMIVMFSIIMLIIIASSITVYAVLSATSVRNKITVSSESITASSTYSSSSNSFNWTFNEAGDEKDISITTTNATETILHNYYNITASASNDLFKAILVYVNNEYMDTLDNIISNNVRIEDEYSFIALNSSKQDTIRFELHQSAAGSIFDGKSNVSVTITTYTETAEYSNYIYVKTENEFKRAVDDVNSGLFDEIPIIIVCNDLSLTSAYTVTNPVKIHIGTYTMSGSITLNDDNTSDPDALLYVLGSGTFNVSVTLGNYYDEAGATLLVKDYVKSVIKNGVDAGSSTNVLGYYSFYNNTITTTGCSYSKPTLVAPNSTNEYYTKIASLTVDGDVVQFKIRGSKTALLDTTLSHLPQNDAIITNDLFLPTYIPGENSVITWKSSNEDVITSEGKIAAKKLDKAEVTLYATIKINDTVLNETFDFKVSAHTNEINFYKLVQEISPIVIANVYSSAADADDALYHLPIVSQNANGTFNTYDYRTSYSSPVNTQLFNWNAYNDIGLESLTYSMTQEQQTAYDYITQSGNTLYLNNTTLNNYAKICVTGSFGNNESYTTYVNISISVGSNTQLLEKAFAKISEDVNDISILGNLLKTRISDGMANEKGDFELTAIFEEDEDYSIEYSGSSTIINSITYDSVNEVYKFAINPEYFNEYETTVAFTATVYYKKGETSETSKSRTFYIVVPAALHISDFGTISIYNSTKYQVFNQLPNNEKNYTSGYTLSGTKLSDANLNYILLRDIVGDSKYITKYANNNDSYLNVINYSSSSQYATGVTTLKYNTSENSQSQMTDQAAYDFARLIEWATGTTRVAASTVVSTTTPISSVSSKKSNGEDYLNDDEISVIKAWYEYYTGQSFSLIENEVLSRAPGYIYTNPELLNQVINCLNGVLSGTFYNGGFATIFGKYMEIIQRYAVSTTTVNKDDAAPCQEYYNKRYRWQESDTALSTYSYGGNSYNIDYTIQLKNGKYWNRYAYAGTTTGGDASGTPTSYATYASDRTSYITENELTVLRVFLLNACITNNSNGLATSITGTYLNSIASILTNDAGTYYYGFSSTDFNTVGKAILNGFDACLEVPTYFTTDGVSILVKYFYNNFNNNNKKYELNSYGNTGKTFDSVVSNNIPYVTNLDSLKSVLSYFENLADLEINGNANLAAFLSKNGLSTLFARVALNNNAITKLVMKYVAHENVEFDLTNINKYSNLTYLDVSNNLGIKSVNELVNVNRSQYTYVNITNIGVEYDYQEFAIDNIASPTCTVWYTNSFSTNTSTNDNSNASYLADLSDFNDFVTRYKYLTNVIQNDDNTTSAVTWRLEDGNEINNAEITASGAYPSISSVSEMNQFVSPYYYATSNFSYNGYTFNSGNLYRINYVNGTLGFVNLGSYTNGSTPNSVSVPDPVIPNNYNPLTTTTYTEEVTSNGTETVEYTYTYYTEGASTKNITITLNCVTFYYGSWYDNYYLYGDASTISYTTNSSNATKFVLLNATEAESLYNRTYESNTTIGSQSTTNASYYFAYIYNNSIYFISNNVANNASVYSTTNFNNASLITISSSGKRLRANNTHYIYFYSDTVYYYTNYRNWNRANVTNSYTYSINFPYFKVYNYDESYQQYNAYSFGYEVRKVTGRITTRTELQKTIADTIQGTIIYYYYTGPDTTYNGVAIKQNTVIALHNDSVFPVSSRTRTSTKTSTDYFLYYWYITNNGGTKTYIDGTNVDYIEYVTSSNEFSQDKVDIFNDELYEPIEGTYGTPSAYTEWSVPLEWGTPTLVVDSYISYVKNVNSSDYSSLVSTKELLDLVGNTNNIIIYRYSGTTGSENVYKESIVATNTTYNRNYGYQLVMNNGILGWTQYATSLTDATGTTMDSLLATANSHFGDYQYGRYYGAYYAYYGDPRYISSGIYLKKQYIYRIMPNESNTAFEWVEIGKYVRDTSDNILIQLGTGQIGVGTIAYSTANAAFGFFYSGWYKVALDDKTNIVNLVKFNDININMNTTRTTLTNDKIKQRNNDYLGYSGTFTIRISAMIRIANGDGTYTEYIKTYKIKFVGSLYE